MSEHKNPLDPANFAVGGGLWEDQVVTVTGLIAQRRTVTADGKDPFTRNEIALTGIADGQDTERQEQYSLGSLVPNEDGSVLTKPDGSPGTIHSKSAAGRFFAALTAAGYDVGKLFDADTGKLKLSALVGERFVFGGVDKMDKDGKPRVNKKGYTERAFYPTKYVGRKGGIAATGNGLSDDTKSAVVASIKKTLSEGPVTRAQLHSALLTEFKSHPEIGTILSAVSKPEFHVNQPWTFDGTRLHA